MLIGKPAVYFMTTLGEFASFSVEPNSFKERHLDCFEFRLTERDSKLVSFTN